MFIRGKGMQSIKPRIKDRGGLKVMDRLESKVICRKCGHAQRL